MSFAPTHFCDPLAEWPEFGLMDDVRPALAACVDRGEDVALATLVATDGPSPRPVGAQMLIRGDGQVAGYVSGGCVEGTVAHIGLAVLETRAPKLVVFGKGSPYFDIALVCGTQIKVAVEAVPAACPAVGGLLAAWRARRPVVWVSALDRAARALADEAPGAGVAGLSADASRFWKRYAPCPRLILVGSDPVAMATARAAHAAGFEIVFIRPLGPEAPPPVPHTQYDRRRPGAALADLALDEWTALVTTTHDLELDGEALAPAFASPAFYIGALGSQKRLALRLDGLRARGVSDAALARLNAPVGLNIGAGTANEIAVSIVADLVAAWRARGAAA